MARGGRRRGTAGQAYSNRTDLNTPKPNPVAFTGQPYGVAKQQAQVQAAMPTATPPVQPGAAPPPGTQAPGVGQPGPPGMPPGSLSTPPGALGDLHRPTDRPNEPVTAGLSGGPGPGPEALTPGLKPTDPITLRLMALYKRFPIQEIADLLS